MCTFIFAKEKQGKINQKLMKTVAYRGDENKTGDRDGSKSSVFNFIYSFDF